MEITKDNISEAVASANKHRDHAAAMRFMKRPKEARKHEQHAKAIYAEVNRLTAADIPADILAMSDDELISYLSE